MDAKVTCDTREAWHKKMLEEQAELLFERSKDASNTELPALTSALAALITFLEHGMI